MYVWQNKSHDMRMRCIYNGIALRRDYAEHFPPFYCLRCLYNNRREYNFRLLGGYI